MSFLFAFFLCLAIALSKGWILGDKLNGPGNITKSLGIDKDLDGENILSGIINLSPRIHPLDRAIAKQRKNAKRNDKHLWRYSLILKWNIFKIVQAQ